MKKILLLGMLLLPSCNQEERPEAPTAAESERLNEAEEMLNALPAAGKSAGRSRGKKAAE